jgi:hypothetical protein
MLTSYVGPSHTEAVQSQRNSNRARSDNEGDRAFMAQRDTHDPSINLMEVFKSLDDDTLRRVFKMPALSESELQDIAKSNAAQSTRSSSPASRPLSPETESYCDEYRDARMCKSKGELGTTA